MLHTFFAIANGYVTTQEFTNIVPSPSPAPFSAQFTEASSPNLDKNQTTKLHPFLDENLVRNIYSDVLSTFFLVQLDFFHQNEWRKVS